MLALPGSTCLSWKPCPLEWHSGPQGSLGPLQGNSIFITADYTTINTTFQGQFMRLTRELSPLASPHTEPARRRVCHRNWVTKAPASCHCKGLPTNFCSCCMLQMGENTALCSPPDSSTHLWA